LFLKNGMVDLVDLMGSGLKSTIASPAVLSLKVTD